MKTSDYESKRHSSKMNMPTDANAERREGNFKRLLWMAIVSYILMFF